MNSYQSAGVNINLADATKELIKQQAATTYRPEVLSGVGFFGGLYRFEGYRKPVLVSSCDGVGTKLRIAAVMDKHEGIGRDIVNHSVNDILTGGAKPLFFLDYIAMGALEKDKIASIAQGLAAACREVNCVLIGGETAEMPGMYTGGDYDLVGFIVGVVEQDEIINGRDISPGDVVLGLPSSGLHTNGYSLVRKVFGEKREKLDTYYSELGCTLGDALLVPHRCYYNELKPHLGLLKGMAHITGGGLLDNVPRVLPKGLTARFDKASWQVPPLFKMLEQQGNVSPEEMYQVFNMGIGMVLITDGKRAQQLNSNITGAAIIGEIIQQEDKERVIIA